MKNTVIISLIVLLCALIACKDKDKTQLTPTPEHSYSSPTFTESEPEPKKVTPLDEILEETTLTGAIEYAKPHMSDGVNEISAGTVLFAAWAAKNLKWDDLVSLPKTKYNLVMKDSDEERAKLFCASGRIVEIKASKVDTLGKLYEGGLITPGWNVVRFLAVKSSGELVSGSHAKFCGVVTEQYSYSNVSGGQTKAVYAVGMFDLPENK